MSLFASTNLVVSQSWLSPSNKPATTVAVSHLICPYSIARVLRSDNGTEFKNQVLRDICIQFHIQQTFISSHHPTSNGLVERTKRKIL